MKQRRGLKALLCVLAAVVLIVGGYVAYVFIDYHRLPDNLPLEVQGGEAAPLAVDADLTLMTYNIGFGAYEPDYGFFMDGGTQSWAWSEDRLRTNLGNIAGFLAEQDPDFLFLQEVDENSTRTYHVDERAYMTGALPDHAWVYAQNWDSPFLFYPFTQPHGKSRTGILTFSRYGIAEALRRSLPVETSVMKIVDLDRCYSVSRVPVENGRELVLFNAHLSAYTSDGAVTARQMRMLLAEMAEEYEKGNYVIGGGDFNRDLLGDSSKVFGISGSDYNWAQPIDLSAFKGLPLTLAAGSNAPTCRMTDGPLTPDTYVLTVDGFVCSDNVQLVAEESVDTGYAWSAHNPARLTFRLRP